MQLWERIAHALEWWDEPEIYAYERRVEIDKNPYERPILPTQVGKEIWLFLGEAHAGNRSAIV
jgi:transposase